MPTDAVAREREGELKAKLARIAELDMKIPGGRMVPTAGLEERGMLQGQ